MNLYSFKLSSLLGVVAAMLMTSALHAADDGSQTILFYGNSMVERLLEEGELEAHLQLAQPEEDLHIRSLAWTGDEVGNRLRLERYATHLKKLLAKWPAKTIVLGYGLNESFHGAEGLSDFKEQYQSHLDQLAKSHPGAKFVLLSPIAIEGADQAKQENVSLYSQAIAELAEKNSAQFIDLFTFTKEQYAKASEPLTVNGIHLNTTGNSLVGTYIASALSGTDTSRQDKDHVAQVALAAAAEQKRVAAVVRPKNGVVYFGVRARPNEYEEEMPRYHKMIALTEEVVHRMAKDPSLKFADQTKPSLDPLPPRKGKGDGPKTGVIKSPAEAMAEFKVADGYEVNLFASEEEFPELRNPVQIAFDARGRLWVVTMPSFPHTVPGLTPPDKIIILEDTDHDGKADKLTPFMEGLDALDGVAFHHDGVIVSEQPRLWLVQDTDGDDRADTKTEILRGIDVTDSHHGGMIAADPYGEILFNDGVFHRSQLETPFGVHRGIDATTYRLNPTTGEIVTEWQHTTPNPWKITHNRWGETFQMYGDGHVYDGTVLTWGPLGAYHPFRYGKIASYGKGSGIAVISSANFPEKWQQGIASGSLLGNYAVNLTAFEDSSGMLKATGNLTVLQSPNAAFRPADVEFGSDGALYISDFCSPIIGHAQHAMRDPYWDHDFGRIWRVVYQEAPLQKDWPKIEGASAAELCKLLVHPIDLVRYHARIELRKHGEDGLAALDQWFAAQDPESESYDQAALEVVFVTGGMAQPRPEIIKSLLQSKSERFRAAALKAIRLEADELDNPVELLALAKNDKHPRVQMELIDAVAHLRPDYPEANTILKGFKARSKVVKGGLAFLDKGTEPLKGRSVPVLEVAGEALLPHWEYLGENGKSKPRMVSAKQNNLPAIGRFRTFVEAEAPLSAILAVKHLNLDVYLNQSLVFTQDSLWSGEQQINVELKKGLNVIELVLRKSRRSKAMPPVFLHGAVGEALEHVTYPANKPFLTRAAESYEKLLAQEGNVLRIQSAAELKYSLDELRAEAGAEVKVIFENPDIMQHNWVLVAPGALEKVGALADQMASQPDAVAKQYLPESSDILASTQLVAPGGSDEIVFTVPNTPGRYPYLCTFPGHWRIMHGILIVE